MVIKVIEHSSTAAQVAFIEEWLDAGGNLDELATAWPDNERSMPIVAKPVKEH